MWHLKNRKYTYNDILWDFSFLVFFSSRNTFVCLFEVHAKEKMVKNSEKWHSLCTLISFDFDFKFLSVHNILCTGVRHAGLIPRTLSLLNNTINYFWFAQCMPASCAHATSSVCVYVRALHKGQQYLHVTSHHTRQYKCTPSILCMNGPAYASWTDRHMHM